MPGLTENITVDYKAVVDERIKLELPGLAAKTTYLYFGYYPQNMAYFPFLRPFECVRIQPYCSWCGWLSLI